MALMSLRGTLLSETNFTWIAVGKDQVEMKKDKLGKIDSAEC